MRYLYHVTTHKNASKILKHGLIPKIGPNSKLVHETNQNIYLCQRKDVPYWRMMLSRPVVLAIDIRAIEPLDTNPDVCFRTFSNYSEYRVTTNIKPEFIKKTHITHKHDTEINRQLGLDQLYGISYVCRRCAEYYTYYIDDPIKASFYINDIKTHLKALLTVTKTINYDNINPENIRALVQTLGEAGEYTFCDSYNNTDKKLYQMLTEYPDDNLTSLRHKLYRFITKKLSCCLNLNTGGWCRY